MTSVDAMVRVRTIEGWTEVSVVCDPSTKARDWSYRLRVVATRGSETREALAGNERYLVRSELDGDFAEHPPIADVPWLPAGSGPIDVLVQLRISTGKSRVKRLDLEGRATLTGDASIALAPCEPLEGAIFERELAPGESNTLSEWPRRVAVPHLGVLSHEGGSDYGSRGTPFSLARHGGAREDIFLPGNGVVPPGQTSPTSWFTFDRLQSSAAGWVAVRRQLRSPYEQKLTVFRPDAVDAAFDIRDRGYHIGFDVSGNHLWSLRTPRDGARLAIHDLRTRACVERNDDSLLLDSTSSVVDDGHLFIYQRADSRGAGPARLHVHDWTRNELLSSDPVPLHHTRVVLARAGQRRIAWLRLLGLETGALSAIRWHDLDGRACGDILVPDRLENGIMLADGRVVVVGRFAWLVSLDHATTRRLGDLGPREGFIPAPLIANDVWWPASGDPPVPLGRPSGQPVATSS
jgi:hypothetical protein